MFHSFRTDSETTDEQCIPESVSEINDSAMDSTEDLDEDEEEDDEELKKVKEDVEIELYEEEDEQEEHDQKEEELSDAALLDAASASGADASPSSLVSTATTTPTTVVPASSPSSSGGGGGGAPMICLEVRDSSTESDKTVLSVNTVLGRNTNGNGAGGVGGLTDSLPSTPGFFSSQASLSLPEIVVEEPRTPPATSPVEDLAAPTGGREGDGAGVSESGETFNNVCKEKETKTSKDDSVTRRPSSPKLILPKASSLPPLSGHCGHRSSLEYDQMSSPVSPLSASSSRSESPLSDRCAIAATGGGASSSLSLHAGSLSASGCSSRQAESDGMMDYRKSSYETNSSSSTAPPPPSHTFSAVSTTTSRKQQSRLQWRRRRKRSERDSIDRKRNRVGEEEEQEHVGRDLVGSGVGGGDGRIFGAVSRGGVAARALLREEGRSNSAGMVCMVYKIQKYRMYVHDFCILSGLSGLRLLLRRSWNFYTRLLQP